MALNNLAFNSQCNINILNDYVIYATAHALMIMTSISKLEQKLSFDVTIGADSPPGPVIIGADSPPQPVIIGADSPAEPGSLSLN